MMKRVAWVASSREDLRQFPRPVQKRMGDALFAAQVGEKHDHAKPLKGFGGAAVLEIVERYDTDAYRAVYTVALYGGPLCQDTGEGHFKVETSPFSRRLAGLSGSSLVCGVVTGAT